MLDWMRRNNKKMLAVFTVCLMVAFIIPQFGKSHNDSPYAVGTVNGRTVVQQELAAPQYYWDFLKQNVFIMDKEGPIPIVFLLGRGSPQASGEVVKQIEENHAMLFLLVDEARRMGVTVSEAELNNLAQAVSIRVTDEKGARLMDYESLGQTELADRVKQSLHEFLMIEKSFARAQSVVKISQPLVESQLALTAQEVKLSAVEILAAEFTAKVPAPTTQQLQEQFAKFADKLPLIDPRENPAGVGYKYADRVGLQYLQVPRAEVEKVIRAGKTDYDWEVEAQKYYKKNQSSFATTQPSRLAPTSNQFSLAPTSQPSTQPAFKPFAEVKSEVIDRLVNPEVDKLQEQISKRIQSAMSLDYVSNRGTIANQSATTQPKSSLGASYTSFEYLQELKADIERQYKVTIKIQSYGDRLFSMKDLNDLPELQSVFLTTNNQANPMIPIAQYAIGLAEKLQPAGSRRVDGLLSNFAPSRPLTDFFGNTYIFRLIDAQPAHKPATLAEVQEKVEADWKAATALEQAKAAAKALQDAAVAASLESATTAAGRKIISTDWIGAQTQWRVPNLNISDNARILFAQQVIELLAQANKDRSKPIYGVISLPLDNKVLLVRLDNSKPAGSEKEIEQTRLAIAARAQNEFAAALPLQWYRYDSVKERNKYVDKSELRKKEKTDE